MQVLEACAGGTSRHVIDLSEGLVARGHKLTLVYSSSRIDNYFKDGLSRLSDSPNVELFDAHFERSIGISDITGAIKLNHIFNSTGRPNIVHLHSSKAGGIGRLPGVIKSAKIFYSPHAFVTTDPSISRTKNFFYKQIEKLLVINTSVLLATSKIEKDHAIQLGFPPKSIYEIPHGVRYIPDTSDERRHSFRNKLRIDSADIVIGFLGRFVPQKDPELAARVAVNICNTTNNTKFVIGGEGPLYDNVKKIISGYEERILLPGYLDVRDAMSGFDIFFLPSRYEGFPYVLIDAIMAGLPIVASNVGGVETVLDDNINGHITKIGDIKSNTNMLLDIINSKDNLSSMSAHSKSKASYFKWERMISDIESVYMESLGH